MATTTVIASIGAATLVALVVGWYWNVRPTVIEAGVTLPRDFPDSGFSHEAFARLLRRFVDEHGRVRYGAWHDDVEARAELDHYVAAVGSYSPEASPNRFSTDADRLAYWMYAYNAFVIKAVLDRWPLDSVTDVKAPLEIVRGFGFFYTLRFVAGGKAYSLYELEKSRIRADGKDPRIHFVLSCASGSCPIVRPELPTGDALESYLAGAARDFVSDPKNLTIDHAARTVALSKIFDWYESDFVENLRRQGRPSDRGVIDYIRTVAPHDLARELERARDYAVAFRKYDWGINASGDPPRAIAR